jgi:DNA-binding MarR family transcriptional regulator
MKSPRVQRTRETNLAPLPDVLQFMQLLWAVAHGLERVSKRMSGEIGVTGPQRLVLRVAGLRPGLSAGDMASVLHVHPSTLTGIVQRLVDQGMLARETDPRHRSVRCSSRRLCQATAASLEKLQCEALSLQRRRYSLIADSLQDLAQVMSASPRRWRSGSTSSQSGRAASTSASGSALPVSSELAIPPLASVDQLVGPAHDGVSTERVHARHRQHVLAFQHTVPNDESHQSRAGVVKQQIADGSQLPARVGGYHHFADHIRCPPRHVQSPAWPYA